MSQLLNAFSPGADLWVIPDIESNWWSQHMDWKLNFQIAKNFSRRPQDISPKLGKILDHCGIEKPNLKPVNANSLLVESRQVLPNRWVLMLDSDWNNNDSIKELVHYWKNLRKPSMRIFLPKQVSKKQALLAWQKNCPENNAEVDFIEEPTHA